VNAVSPIVALAASFEQRHRRPLRVLHIGNIANNAYLNAKLLNRSGYDCDVICYDYYHAMACPEWEETEGASHVVDEMSPDWRSMDLQGFERPRWFAQGPFALCVEYLVARREGRRLAADVSWGLLGDASRFSTPSIQRSAKFRTLAARTILKVRQLRSRWRASLVNAAGRTTQRASGVLARTARLQLSVAAALRRVVAHVSQAWRYLVAIGRYRGDVFAKIWALLRRFAEARGVFGWTLAIVSVPVLFPGAVLIRAATFGLRRGDSSVSISSDGDAANLAGLDDDAANPAGLDHDAANATDPWLEGVLVRFGRLFASRADQLKGDDVIPYRCTLDRWRRLFACYDVVIGYSTDATWPMLADYVSYIAYEHGTIRDIPWEDTPRGRLCAMAYATAPVVYVTNADSLVHARTLGARTLVHGFHGFDEAKLQRRIDAARRAGATLALDANPDRRTVFFAPARHHWRDGFPSWRKGNDVVIRAAAQLAEAFPERFRLVFINWGAEVELSKRLIDELGVAAYVEWREPMPKAELLRHYATVDCVIDQFVLPCIGAVTLEAIAVGHAPVMTLLDDAAMAEHYGETIPLFNCGTVQEVFEAMRTVMAAPGVAAAVARSSRQWFEKYHSGARLEASLAEALRRCVPALEESDATV
jgi:glycosyltransferase involved in cell wall biosynthesis